MATVATYLNFPRNTEEAFNFHQSVFKTEFYGPIMRFGPQACGDQAVPEADQDLVMHVGLPILGGHLLVGTDTIEGMGQPHVPGNDVSIINWIPSPSIA